MMNTCSRNEYGPHKYKLVASARTRFPDNGPHDQDSNPPIFWLACEYCGDIAERRAQNLYLYQDLVVYPERESNDERTQANAHRD